MQQHQNQAFPGQAPLRQIQQSPNLSNNSLSQQRYTGPGQYPQQPPPLQSPYLGPSHFTQAQQHPGAPDRAYYTTHPSPRSSNGGAYYSTEKSDPMATATMQRPFPPMFHTPQTGSPVSVTSPQPHDHTRPMYSQQSNQLHSTMYSTPYSYSPLSHVQTPYGSHTHSSMNTNPMMPGQYATTHLQHHQLPSQTQDSSTSPRLKQESGQPHYTQTPQQHSSLATQQQTPGVTPRSSIIPPPHTPGTGSTSTAAPGPIPATTPLVIKQDESGVQWIEFEYSRDRVKMSYLIRCDTESVNTNTLSQEFKGENCVYPRACVSKDQYKGNRLNYETECNQVGWALAELNICLRGKRGLIQRAVDSWRNSNADTRLRSRRVRRQAKMSNKARVNPNMPPHTPDMSNTSSLSNHGSMSVPISRTNTMPLATQTHGHHIAKHEMSSPNQDHPITSYSMYPSYRSSSGSLQHSSPNELRHAQTFPSHQTYPVSGSQGPSMAPPVSGNMYNFNRSGGSSGMTSKKRRRGEEEEDDTQLFGDLPENKKRKFILVDDTQKNARVRVKITLDQVEMQEVPDSYRKHNSVFPRAYYPLQMQDGADSALTRFSEEESDPADDAPPTAGRIAVPCSYAEPDEEFEVPRLSHKKRDRECRVNELGYRMAWGQRRVFSNRPIFLGRALDAYRNKQRMALTSAGHELEDVPAHLEVRPGKRRWLERMRHTPQTDLVPRPQSAS